MYPTTCRGATSVLYFVWSSWKYKHVTFKPIHFGFRYVLFSCERIVWANDRDTPCNEESAQIKIIMIHFLYSYNNEYLSVFPWGKSINKIGETEFNKIILDGMPNGWSKQACVQGFNSETITYKICKYFWTYGNFWEYFLRCSITFL